MATLGAGALASQPQAPATPSPPVDVSACQACHGESGISRNPRVPNLAGQQVGLLGRRDAGGAGEPGTVPAR
jgi:cytochrome c553